MAGGEGTRLRPLTCDCPKPMIQLMQRPVMQYALALLKQHGIADIAATLGYLPDAIRDYFGEGDDFGVALRYTTETAPLGTAGGVKQAQRFLDETFVVLSGDGVTDLDITDAVAFHRRRGALATLVLKRADNPLDYGVVLTEADGRVRSFHEKPDWSDVISDTVNTGIYILEPEVLDHIPADRPCDFGQELFPALVRQGLPVYGYVMQGYWCDIGDVRAYLQAHVDALEGRIHVPGLLPEAGRVAQLPGAMVDRSAVLEGPCLIGPDARVLAGAYVGPYSVVGAGCVIGEAASLKRAVLWPGARLMSGAQARGCVVGTGATLGEGAQAYEESVLGTGAAIGQRTVLLPGVKLWPGKHGADGERLEANLIWGGRREMGFVAGAMPVTAPDQAIRAAQAVCAVLRPRELLLGRGAGSRADAQWHAAVSGAMAQGARVLDAGVCTLPQLAHALRTLRCDGALLVEARRITPLNALGARLPGRQQRAIAGQNARQDFSVPFQREVPGIEPADGIRAAYVCDIAAHFTAEAKDAPPVALFARDPLLRELAGQAFRRAGLFLRVEVDPASLPGPGELGITLEDGGERCTLSDERGALSEAEQQLLLAWTLLAMGEAAILLPTQATRAVQALAARRGARVEYVSGEGTLWMNALAERFPRQFALHSDGLRAAMAMLSALAETRLTLADWRRDMPPVSRRCQSVPIAPGQTGRILRAMARREQHVEFGGGMRFRRKDGWAWICPDGEKPRLRIVTEAASEEYARELCDFCERELRRIAGEKR